MSKVALGLSGGVDSSVAVHLLQAAGHEVMTSFVGAAIANAMAVEIFDQLQSGTMTNAANLTDTNQLTEYCTWLIGI